MKNYEKNYYMIEKEEIKIGNELIAKFVGESNYTTHLEFHENWNWLISVVEAVEAIRDEKYGWFLVNIQLNTCSIQSKYLPETYLNRGKPTYMSDPNAVFPTKIESTWYNIVQFIKFWNEANNLDGNR